MSDTITLTLACCPFCGGEPAMMHQSREYYVMCRACHATSRLCETHMQAVEAWNLRNDMSYALADSLNSAHSREDQLSADLAASREREARLSEKLRGTIKRIHTFTEDHFGNTPVIDLAEHVISNLCEYLADPALSQSSIQPNEETER